MFTPPAPSLQAWLHPGRAGREAAVRSAGCLGCHNLAPTLPPAPKSRHARLPKQHGVLCPVTFAMHLAAAVEVKGGRPKNRPCAVVAGGREPCQWEAYPHHQYIHRNGALLCCDDGGCWKSRTKPLGDGDEKDRPENLCVDVVNGLPRCMDMITATEVCRRIELYFNGGVCQYLTERQAALAKPFLAGAQ